MRSNFLNRAIACTMSVLLLAGCLTGCGLNGAAGNNQAASGDEPVTITYAMWQTNLSDYMKERITAFESENPNIKVELDVPEDYQKSASIYWDELNQEDAKDLPDVFSMNAPNFLIYQKAGKLMPIDDLTAESDTLDLETLPQSLCDTYRFDGKLYGIPVDYDTIGLWYNKEIFKEAGLEYPNMNWTWNDLRNAAQKISSMDGVYGFLTSDVGQLGYYNTVMASGGYLVRNNDDFGLEDSKTQDGIQSWVDLAQYSPSLDAIEASGGPHMLFMQGKVGMLFGGDWEAADFTGKDSVVADSINVTMLPTMASGSRASVIHGKANVISAKTQHPAEAKKFLEFLSSDESYQKLGETGLCIPAHSSYSDLFFKQYPQYDMGIFAREAVDYSAAYPSSSVSGWAETIDSQIAKMLRGEVTVTDGCRQAMSELNQ